MKYMGPTSLASFVTIVKNAIANKQDKIRTVGLLKGTGSAVTQAVAGTDYAVPALDKTATLSATGWSSSAPYTQTVSVAGITATMRPIVSVSLSALPETAEAELVGWANVDRIETGAGEITATCFSEVPTVTLNMSMKVVS